MNEITLKSGKKWKLNSAYNGDCLDFMQQLPDKCIDLVLTDPPYGIGVKSWDFTKPNRPELSKRIRAGYKKYEHKEWDSEIPEEEIFSQIFRISKDQIIFGANYFSHYLPPARGWLYWGKGADYTNSSNFSHGELAYTSFDKRLLSCVFSPKAGTSGGKDRIHPTQKPLKLFKWCLEKYAPENAIVFDPFLGSFTTAVACHSHGLNWIGCEKDEDYFKAGLDRYDTVCLQHLMDFD